MGGEVGEMTRRQRVRRVAILCCHYLQNLAYYKAGWNGRALKRKTHFWISANGNFLDHCVLEFCKLFGDPRGKHYWRKVVTDEAGFYTGLLAELKLNGAEFDEYVAKMRNYRDKFVAHLDLDEVMHIPYLSVGRKAVAYLYDYLRDHEDEGNFFSDASDTADDFYAARAKEGVAVYD